MSTRVLYPAATKPHTSERSAPLQLSLLERWHLLSLDAPCVASVWTWFLARSTSTNLSAPTLAAMFLAVWILYAGDRLLDARAVYRGADSALEARHYFHARHRSAFLVAIALAIPALVISLAAMPGPLLRAYILLAALLATWLGIIHTNRTPSRLPKEFAVGLFFALAVGLPSAFAGAAPGVFACLTLGCALMSAANCLFLLAWENRPGRSSHHPAAAMAVRYLVPITAAAMFLCLAISCVLVRERHSLASALPTLASTLSLALLLTLHRTRQRFARTTLRALADMALLTPLLLAPVLFILNR